MSKALGAGRRADVILSLLLAAGLVLLGAGTTSGSDLTPNTWGELVLLGVGTVVAATAVVRGLRLGAWAALALVAFAALAALTAASIAWSVTPDQSWLEAARTVSYLCAFGSALALARLFPNHWGTLLFAIAALAVVLTGWALVVKVFTLGAGGQIQYGRLLAPFGYWNATGTMAGMGMPVVLWAGSRRDAGRLMRSLSVPVLALLATVVILSYSRTALAAAIVGLVVSLAFGSYRLRGLLLLGLAAAGAAVLSAWALGDHSLTGDHVALAARRSADGSFGLAIVLAVVALTAIGFGASRAIDRITLQPATRRRINLLLVCAVALVPAAGVAALAASSRGLTGEVSHVFSTLTSSQTHVGNSASRLVNLANSRPRYWRQALSVTDHHVLLGAGAGSFGVAHLRYATATLTTTNAQHAHSYVFETLADLGIAGLAVSLALLLSWGTGAWRTLRRRGQGILAGLEPDGMWTLLAVVLVFGVSSSFDWTWFYPGLAVPALLCAGWLGGRHGVANKLEADRPDRSSPREKPAVADKSPDRSAVRSPAQVPGGSRTRPEARRGLGARSEAQRTLTGRPAAIIGLTGLMVAAIALGFAIWQPLGSADSTNAGISAITSGDAGQALADARAAAASDPVSLEPLQELSAVYDATGNRAAATAELVKATTVQPDNPLPWGWLGSYELQLHRYGPAVAALRRAAQLDVTNVPVRQELAQAQQHLRSGTS